MKKSYIYLLALVTFFIFSVFKTGAQSEVLFFDDFEQYEDFTITDVGEWLLINADQEENTGIGGVSFPNNGATSAYMIFNSTQVPELEEQISIGRDFTAYSGEKVIASFAARLPPSNDWMISPKITLGESGNIVSFWAKASSAKDNNERFRVLVSTTDREMESFTPITPEPYVAMHNYVEPNNEAHWVNFAFSLDTYKNQDVYIAINCVSSFYTVVGPPRDRAFILLIDDFEVKTGGCITQISDAKATNTTTSSATITWSGLQSEFEIEYGETDFTIGEGTHLSVSSTECDITGLSPQTAYEFYIRSKCSEDSYGMWTGPFKFRTEHLPTDLDYSYSFETEDVALDGWKLYSPPGRAQWKIMNFANVAHDGENSINYLSDGETADAWIISRAINLKKDHIIAINFWYFSSQYSPEKMKVTIGKSAKVEDHKTVVWTNEAINNTEYEEGKAEFTVPETGIYYLGFNCFSAGNAAELHLDDIKITDKGTGIAANIHNSSLNIYPNPVKNNIFISLPDTYNRNETQIIITDITGRIIRKIHYKPSVNLEDLQGGIYYLSVTDNIRKESRIFIRK